MRKMKGAGPAVASFVQWAFLVLIAMFLIFIIWQWVVASEAGLKNVEEANLVYTITSSVNGFSVAEKGRMEIDLKTAYDIEVKCESDGKCYIVTTPYNGKRGEPSEEFLIVGNIEQKPVKLVKTMKVCVEKGYEDPKDKVVINKC